MKFSEYVIVEKPGVFIDPLGFLKPSRALQDTLFRQFTVLSNHPAYHGVLCAIWQSCDDAGVRPGANNHALFFRQLELFWGLMNAAQGGSVINVNKYKQLLAHRMGIKRIAADHSIFQRLAYGTLGHYSRPSMEWGLLSDSGRALVDDGHRLAHAFSNRSGMDFIAEMNRWRRGEEFSLERLAKLGEVFHLTASASQVERAAWRDILAKRMKREPQTRALWDAPLPLDEMAEADKSAAAYCSYQAGLTQRYGAMADRLHVVQTFERLSGAVQFVFDLNLASLQFRDGAELQPLSDPEDLAHAIVELATKAVSMGVVDAGRLFFSLAATRRRYADVCDVIAQHHWSHQRSKGVSPYFDATGLLIRDKVQRAEMGATLEALEHAPTSQARMDLLHYRSRRDWHFHRCRTYHDWAHGAAA